MRYEMVAGLETHVELSTRSKIFCGCSTQFGAAPNTSCCPVCIGLPGTLPVLNREVVRYAIKAGLALNCKIETDARMDRKNYVYPDLAKAYQISEFDRPLCYGGYLELSNGRRIGIARIHIEEDAGKLVHSRGGTLVDYNRAGVPLIEIVTEPDFRGVEECREYLERLQLIMRYIGVSDCRMQEGSLRCDVNVSLRPVGSMEYGTRAEIKNMNSFAFMVKALEYEVERQADLLESGMAVEQETRRFNPETGETESMRGKEDAQDYRYFREPDLAAIRTSPEEIEQLRESLPELPEQRVRRYVKELGLAQADAEQIARYPAVAAYFEEAVNGLASGKTAANLMTGAIFRRMPTEAEREMCALRMTAQQFGELLKLVDTGKLRLQLARQTLEKMLETGRAVGELISEADMAGVDRDKLRTVCIQAIEQNERAVKDYRSGKHAAMGAILGAVMRACGAQADANEVRKMLVELLNGQQET